MTTKYLGFVEALVEDGDRCVTEVTEADNDHPGYQGVWLHDGLDALQANAEDFGDCGLLAIWLWQYHSHELPSGYTSKTLDPVRYVRVSPDDLIHFGKLLVQLGEAHQ